MLQRTISTGIIIVMRSNWLKKFIQLQRTNLNKDYSSSPLLFVDKYLNGIIFRMSGDFFDGAPDSSWVPFAFQRLFHHIYPTEA